MSTESDRRTQEAPRIPFDAMVEVGGALGPSFEAQAVNLSEEGMHLRTAYLPEVGQPVTCRFDAGQGMVVVAAGEVLWNEDMGNGGEFGIRFTNLDGASMSGLQRILGMAEEGPLPKAPTGRKVRLHIEGLASPMRARVKNTEGSSVTAFSELGFLKVGKQLDLEDAMTGSKRPALIDRVEVEVERDSKIPQLVVTLRYDDEEAHAAAPAQAADVADSDAPPAEGTPSPSVTDDPHSDTDDEGSRVEMRSVPLRSEAKDSASIEESSHMKSSFARNAAKVTPALNDWAKRTKTAIALLAARAMKKSGGSGDDIEIPLRRTTAPAPSGGLHAAGRKVVRGEVGEDRVEEEPKKGIKITKKRAMIAGGVTGGLLLVLLAMHKSPAPAATAETTAAAVAPQPTAPPAPPPAPIPAATVSDPLANAAMGEMSGSVPDRPFNGKVVPFTNGAVGSHGNVLKIKMDGRIEKIEGASQPTGFTVVIPGRKSVDAAAPLASKDPRIAAIRVANEPQGAELAVTFKDGVPNYQVRAKGETLELVLAKPNRAGDKAPEAHATKKRKKH